MKHCIFCEIDHPQTSTFWRIRGNYYQCKSRILETHRKWVERNPGYMTKANMKSYYKNREKVVSANYQYAKERRKRDVNYNLTILLRQRLCAALKKQYKSGSAVADLGCSIADLRIYLEAKFSEGMNWDNHGTYGWHIDHIIPLSSFDLGDTEQFKQAVNYRNLQPLWAEDNLTKSNRVSA